MRSNKLPIVLAILSFIGLLDGAYLTWKHYTNGSVNCSLTAGCEQVLTSQYSTIAGVPLSLIGAIYYVVLFFLCIALLDTDRPLFVKLIALISGAGVLFSSYLVYLQVAMLKSICIYCMLSATTTTLIFIMALIGLRIYKFDQEIIKKGEFYE
jgi:uncharacterized membrane protein